MKGLDQAVLRKVLFPLVRNHSVIGVDYNSYRCKVMFQVEF